MFREAGRPPWRGRHFQNCNHSKSRKANYTPPDAAEPQFRWYGAEAASAGAGRTFGPGPAARDLHPHRGPILLT